MKGRELVTLNGGYAYREQVRADGAGVGLLGYLSRKYRHSSFETWRERLEKGELFLDGAPVQCDCVLKAGQWLAWHRPPWDEPEVPLSYAVLYEDEDILAVDKPRGLPTVPAGGFLDHTLFAQVRKSYPEAGPLHRLGRGTSGIVLFARTFSARSVLSRAFRNRAVLKVYRTLVQGHPVEDRFRVDSPIGPVPHPRLGTIHAASSEGKRALSRVLVLERREAYSLVEVTIETGRPHQIRIHMAVAGHPLVGDPLYTVGGRLRGQGTALPGDPGYRLHACRVSLPHPSTGKVLSIFSPLPPELL